MSGSTTTNNATTGTTGSSGSSSASLASSAGATALQSLTSNFNDFLNLLMTQLQNQDPSSPMDTQQFTTELVQFAGVAQQVSGNQSLTQLIQLTQAGQVLQSSSIVGHKVLVQSTQMPLQNGTGGLQITAAAPQKAAIAIYDSAGNKVRDASVSLTTGANKWSWDGTNNQGATMPDGAYTVAVTGASGAALPFAVQGTATGVVQNNSALQLELGPLAVDFSAVQALVS